MALSDVIHARNVYCPKCNTFLYNTADMNNPEETNRNVDRKAVGSMWVVECKHCHAPLCAPTNL